MITRLLLRPVCSRPLSYTTRTFNPFSILGVSVNASKQDVKKAYRSKVMDCHPDLHPDDEKKKEQFIRVQEAYESIMSGNAKTGGSTQTNHQAAQQASQRQHGFSSQYSERPKQKGFDFNHNYRQRMRARAEWEKIQNERRHHNNPHAYGHHAKWSKTSDTFHEEKPFKERRDNSSERRKHFRQDRHDFTTETDEERYRRAKRVQENLNKAEYYDSRNTQRENHDDVKHQFEQFENNMKRKLEDQDEVKRKLRIFSMAMVMTMFFMIGVQAREARNAYEKPYVTRMTYDTQLLQWNEHTKKNFDRLAEQNRKKSNEQAASSLTPEENESILNTLERNSAQLKRNDSDSWNPR